MSDNQRRRPRAILLDAFGTLLELEPPAPALRERLRERLGVALSRREAEQAMAAEIAYYRAHLNEGRDRASLVDLRRRCAVALRDALPDGRSLPLAGVGDALMGSLRFRPYPDAPPALDELRALGLRLIVVSNWDVSLPARLGDAGLLHRVHGVITSAELGGVQKPQPAIFAHALTLAGVPPELALHVGDSPSEDVSGARAAGIEPLLLVRQRVPAARPRRRVRTITSLLELPALAA
ncbi:MAG TPA: HAD family hydrolase [Solirubrobacteraceae bacterium]|nr:HAD family hydrolase [Solirubrobacteraceae bacterium]